MLLLFHLVLLGGSEILVDRAHGAAQLVVAGGGGAEASGGRLDEALGSVAGLAEGIEAAVEVRERHRTPGLADCGGRRVDQRVVGTNPSLSPTADGGEARTMHRSARPHKHMHRAAAVHPLSPKSKADETQHRAQERRTRALDTEGAWICFSLMTKSSETKTC